MTEKEINKTAKELFEKRTEDVLYSNPRGEFFTNKNFCELSLKNDEKLTVHKRPASAAANQEKGKNTSKKTDKKSEKSSDKGKDTSKKEEAPKGEDPATGTSTDSVSGEEKSSNPKK